MAVLTAWIPCQVSWNNLSHSRAVWGSYLFKWCCLFHGDANMHVASHIVKVWLIAQCMFVDVRCKSCWILRQLNAWILVHCVHLYFLWDLPYSLKPCVVWLNQSSWRLEWAERSEALAQRSWQANNEHHPDKTSQSFSTSPADKTNTCATKLLAYTQLNQNFKVNASQLPSHAVKFLLKASIYSIRSSILTNCIFKQIFRQSATLDHFNMPK